MASLLCVKSMEGNVKVHNKDTAVNLATEEDDLPVTYMRKSSAKKNRAKRPNSTPNTLGSAHAPSMDAGCLINNTMKMQDWISKKQVKDIQKKKEKAKREKSLVESCAIRRMFTPLLETEYSFVKDVGEYLDHTDLLELRKKELLHKNWNDRVYEPIRRKILEAMNGQDWTEKDRRRRELHRQYLEHVNRKGHVFLDTMDKGEYYAQALNHFRPAPITIQTAALQDPLLVQARERNKEDQTILRCTTGQVYSHSDIDQVKLPPLPLVPLGRHGTDSIAWLDMPLGNIESTPRKASRSSKRSRAGKAASLRMKGSCTQTQIDFNEWSKVTFDSRMVDQEMQLQKKRMFEEKPPYGIPPRQFAKAAFASTTTSSEHKGLCPVNT